MDSSIDSIADISINVEDLSNNIEGLTSKLSNIGINSSTSREQIEFCGSSRLVNFQEGTTRDEKLNTINKYIYRKKITDEQIRQYKIPEGTNQCGNNCLACSLLFLGIMNTDEADAYTRRCIVQDSTLTPIICLQNAFINEMVKLDVGTTVILHLTNATGSLEERLLLIETVLQNEEAILLIYGSIHTPNDAHIVVLRKEQNRLRLYDPQRGTKSIGQFHNYVPTAIKSAGPGATMMNMDDGTLEHAIIRTEDYYKVSGIEYISQIMRAQVIQFRYTQSSDPNNIFLEFFIIQSRPHPVRGGSRARKLQVRKRKSHRRNRTSLRRRSKLRTQKLKRRHR